MSDAPEPVSVSEAYLDRRCEVCGYVKWQIRGMLICKNCTWRADEAERKAKT
jgi:uncharacterized Zn finger protein (UPF0148 family)